MSIEQFHQKVLMEQNLYKEALNQYELVRAQVNELNIKITKKMPLAARMKLKAVFSAAEEKLRMKEEYLYRCGEATNAAAVAYKEAAIKEGYDPELREIDEFYAMFLFKR